MSLFGQCLSQIAKSQFVAARAWPKSRRQNRQLLWLTCIRRRLDGCAHSGKNQLANGLRSVEIILSKQRHSRAIILERPCMWGQNNFQDRYLCLDSNYLVRHLVVQYQLAPTQQDKADYGIRRCNPTRTRPRIRREYRRR